MDINKIREIEPRVNVLLDCSQSLSNSTLSGVEKDRIWYRVLKPTLVHCVGFLSTTPELANTEAYDIVYRRCIELGKL